MNTRHSGLNAMTLHLYWVHQWSEFCSFSDEWDALFQDPLRSLTHRYYYLTLLNGQVALWLNWLKCSLNKVEKREKRRLKFSKSAGFSNKVLKGATLVLSPGHIQSIWLAHLLLLCSHIWTHFELLRIKKTEYQKKKKKNTSGHGRGRGFLTSWRRQLARVGNSKSHIFC